MSEHYRGRGVLRDDKGQRLATVDYDFDLSIERGAIGVLHSSNLHLPKLTVLRLRLDDCLHYLEVRVVLIGFDRLRKLCEYGIYMLPEQPSDKYNLLMFRQSRKQLSGAVD